MMKRRSRQLNLALTRETINTYCCYTFFFKEFLKMIKHEKH